MKNLVIICFFIITGCAGFSGSSNPVHDDIIIYGTARCGLCTDLKNSLVEEQIDFHFKDVSEDAEANKEMFKKLEKTDKFDGYAYYPVVDVKGIILVRPDLQKIKDVMK
ncbi:MAG: glutaredoxin family protein [Spirochaetes bacterium]|nr:glutaredoxin family protein [Spirochaetota bacterium]